MKAVLVLSTELRFAQEALPRNFLMHALEVSFEVSQTVEVRAAVFTSVWLVIRVLLLVMFPKNFLMKLLPTPFESADEARRLMVPKVKPQVFNASVHLSTSLARDLLIAMHVLDVLL